MKIKYLSFGLKAKSGRNNQGRKTVFHRIQGHKKRYRIIDFYRNLSAEFCLVIDICKDPNRTAHIALICTKSGILSYIIAVNGLKKNTFITPGVHGLGSVTTLCNLYIGCIISSLEISQNYGAKLIRAAGCFGVITSYSFIQNEQNCIVKLPSGEERLFHANSTAAVGRNSNLGHHLIKWSKAGDSLKLGHKPTVRGVAKNAVDHPHGGGRGKTANLATAVNFTGRVKKGVSSCRNLSKYRLLQKNKKC